MARVSISEILCFYNLVTQCFNQLSTFFPNTSFALKGPNVDGKKHSITIDVCCHKLKIIISYENRNVSYKVDASDRTIASPSQHYAHGKGIYNLFLTIREYLTKTIKEE